MTWGRVQFAPVATGDNKFPGKPAFGWIQPDGTFALGTLETDDGAIVGKHQVTIYRRKPESDGGAAPDAPASPSLDPISDLKFDKLTLMGQLFDVKPGIENDIVIELTSRVVKQYGEVDD